MFYRSTLIICCVVAGCDGPLRKEPPDDGTNPGAVSTTPPSFNGGFDERDMPSCVTLPNGSVSCGWPTDASYGWGVSPPEVFRGTRGHGGTFFQYGAGRANTPPRAGYPSIPDNTALYFQLCYTANDPAWCNGFVTVRSSRFPVSQGARHRLSAWARSSVVLATGQPQEHRLRVSARYLNSAGGSVAVDGFQFSPNAAPLDTWTENFTELAVPAGATEAQIEIEVDRNRQSNIYVDDVMFTPF